MTVAHVAAGTYSVEETATRLGVSAKTVYRMVADDQLDHVRVRGRIRVPRGIVEAMVGIEDRGGRNP